MSIFNLFGLLSDSGKKEILGYKPDPDIAYASPEAGTANNFLSVPKFINDKPGNPKGRFLRVTVCNKGNIRISDAHVTLKAIETLSEGCRKVEKYGPAFFHWANRAEDGARDLPPKCDPFYCDIVYGVENSKPLTLFLEEQFLNVGIPTHLGQGEYCFHLGIDGKSDPEIGSKTWYLYINWAGKWDQIEAKMFSNSPWTDIGPLNSATTYHIPEPGTTSTGIQTSLPNGASQIFHNSLQSCH